MFKLRDGAGPRFAELMDMVSDAASEVRFRFTSPHPKDFPDTLLDVIASKPNVCKQIHIVACSIQQQKPRHMLRLTSSS